MKKIRKTRAEKHDETRRSIFESALSIVGESGYTGASISKITERAGIAQGTFYNYFKSRQDLFDQLLPFLGSELLEYIKMRLSGISDPIEREEVNIHALTEFLNQYPEFDRIFQEAFVFAPEAYKTYLDSVALAYRRTLSRTRRLGHLQHFRDHDIETVAYALIGSRSYMYEYLTTKDSSNATRTPPDASMVEAYIKFIRYGLFGAPLGPFAEHEALDGGKTRVSFVISQDQLDQFTSAIAEVAQGAARRAMTQDGSEWRVSLKTFNFNMLRPAQPGRIVAVASCEAADRIVSLRITQDDEQGDLLAMATASFEAAAASPPARKAPPVPDLRGRSA